MKKQPLAYRMRPTDIAHIIGQSAILGEGMLLRRMVETKQLSSMILYGPPGTGKTSLARAIAGTCGYPFRMLNAATHQKKDIVVVIEEAKMSGSLLLILDEVHRLDKGKQDLLLPHLENGQLCLIGATTANPYHAINPAVRSRCHIFELATPQPDDIENVLRRALRDSKNGFGEASIHMEEEAIPHLARACGGDVRAALNALELAVLSTPKNEHGERHITLKTAEQSIQKKYIQHDKDGDAHYDVLSAFQKSIRGSDVNASLHYLARLLVAGDFASIHRRLLVIAYEDIGLANPQAGPRTLAAIEASERLGPPEARIPLANAVVELALSPKSNSAYQAIDHAIAALHKGESGTIPRHLKDAHYQGAKQLGNGLTYQYPHNHKSGWVKQQYLPDAIAHHQYYDAKKTGKFEQALAQVYETLQHK
ncbi:replication-associated recombination protein A [Shouchella lonarensis]|uniref:Replication-associated recombination protein A n=1 Tax=Shouchella lonarensis TaxID=1464122 RepID=A0A1G6JM53_9BACI|nr:replication-associated recombination protein A [Shouchella lonarensis]SDC19829.1 Recombination protein MgsA [Shouchella lonarensis]